MVVRNVPFVDWGTIALSVLVGRHENSKYISFHSTDRVRIESEEDIVTDLDGEKGMPLPVDVSVLPHRLEVCVPEDWEDAGTPKTTGQE
jgi:diacylglycerol kinase family enzyme